ncbi:MAG: HAMP domain-containing histidine kinase [Burkholderiaceae bacterium]|jgi:signal transduction histidine kinase|nr:HAMP domain-containing histidine kinase [Burkholderiaceae bacterium]
MNLNLATAAVFSSMVEIALCIGMLVLWTRERVRYLVFWSSGFFAFGVGALLVSLRERITDIFSILVANTSLTLSSILFYVGICLFFDRRRSWLPWMLLVLIAEVALLAHFVFVDYHTTARVYVYNTAQTLIVLATLQTLFSVIHEKKKEVNPEVVIVTSLFFAAHSVRSVGTPFFPAPQDFLASGNFQTLLAFGLMLIHIAYAQAFGNMHAAALNAELNAALTDAKIKERQKVEVLGYVSHDLRAPLATIRGYSELLLANAPKDQQGSLQMIQRSVKYQLDLINELLEYAKSELQPLAVKPVTTDLHLLLDDISEYAIALCSQQGNRFEYQVSERLPRHITVDGKRLQQVLLNLLSNAAKFTRGGSVTLSVTARPDKAGCALFFAVSDTGIGIDLNQGIDIFGAFQQMQAENGSTGLGLFISQRILSAMGGSLNVTSTSGEGTTFSFAFFAPVVDAYGTGWPIVARRQAQPRSPAQHPTIPPGSMPTDQALDELAHLALHGRLTDIERWIEIQSGTDDYAPYLDLLKSSLEQFDFSAIHMLASHRRSTDMAEIISSAPPVSSTAHAAPLSVS